MLRVNTFDLAGHAMPPDESDTPESERVSALRTVVREAIARGITLVLDRDRFMRRVVDVISQSVGYPGVVAYLYDAGSSQMSLVAATEDAPQWLPRRLDGGELRRDIPHIVESASVLGTLDPEDGQHMAVLPLIAAGEAVGYIFVLDMLADSLTPEDLQALAVVAEEIGPAALVAIQHHRMRQSSVIDQATGAYTYEHFLRRFDEEISRAQRTEHAVTIVLVEIWHIEYLEDVAGYERADEMLRELASRIAAVMRASDVVARRQRTGFALLLPESDVIGADLTIQRIHEQLRRIKPEFAEVENSGQSPIIVAGSSTFPIDGQNAAELLLAADQRLLAVADELEIATR